MRSLIEVTRGVRVLLGMATTVALITRRVGGTKRKYSMAEGEGLYGRREGWSPGRSGMRRCSGGQVEPSHEIKISHLWFTCGGWGRVKWAVQV